MVSESDPVELALASALERASAAEQWTAVEVLAREIEARRRARAGVVDLATPVTRTRALSVRQTWSWALAAALKPVENNRPRRFHYRGPLLIHASRTVVRADYAEACDLIEQLSGQRPPAELPLGCIVGAAVLTGCAQPLERDQGWRFAGQYGLQLERAVELPLRPLRAQSVLG